MATHPGILAWEIAWTEDPGGRQSMGSQRVGHGWSQHRHIYQCIYLSTYLFKVCQSTYPSTITHLLIYLQFFNLSTFYLCIYLYINLFFNLSSIYLLSCMSYLSIHASIHLSSICLGAKSLQSCLILCDLMDCSPSGSSVYGILQARTLEQVAISSSRDTFPTQGLNPSLLYCRWVLYHLSLWGSPTP